MQCRLPRLTDISAATVFVLLACTGPAHAYIDPGTGSFLLQMLAAAAVGSLFFIRRIVDRVRALFSFRRNADRDTKQADEEHRKHREEDR